MLKLKSNLFRCLALLGFLAVIPACQDNSQFSKVASDSVSSTRAFIRIPTKLVDAHFIATTNFIRDHKHDRLYAFGYIDRDALDRLDERTFRQIIELDPQAWAKHDFDPRTLKILDRRAHFDSAAEGYHDYDALTSELQSLADEFPDLAELASAGKSVQGRELWYLRISDHIDTDEHEPKLLYIANMHGDETVGRELMIYLARHLLRDYTTDNRVKTLVDNAEIFIMPSMNPDGYEAQTRFNAHFQDLNRSFPDFTSDPNDSISNREPEVQAIMNLHAQNEFVMAINFHGGEVCFNVPWDTEANGGTNKFGDNALMLAVGHEYASQNQTMVMNNEDSFDHGVTYGYEWYEVNGGMQDWADYYRNSIHATVELSRTKWPDAGTLMDFWNENKESLMGYLEAGTLGAHLHIESSDGDDLTNIAVTSSGRTVKFRNSYLHRPTLSGDQTITIAADGYQTAHVNLAASRFNGQFTEVVLNKN